MEVVELDEALNVLDSSLSLMKWRLKSQSKRRLEIGPFLYSLPSLVFLFLLIPHCFNNFFIVLFHLRYLFFLIIILFCFLGF